MRNKIPFEEGYGQAQGEKWFVARISPPAPPAQKLGLNFPGSSGVYAGQFPERFGEDICFSVCPAAHPPPPHQPRPCPHLAPPLPSMPGPSFKTLFPFPNHMIRVHSLSQALLPLDVGAGHSLICQSQSSISFTAWTFDPNWTYQDPYLELLFSFFRLGTLDMVEKVACR